jgi:hypothetical protein
MFSKRNTDEHRKTPPEYDKEYIPRFVDAPKERNIDDHIFINSE